MINDFYERLKWYEEIVPNQQNLYLRVEITVLSTKKFTSVIKSIQSFPRFGYINKDVCEFHLIGIDQIIKYKWDVEQVINTFQKAKWKNNIRLYSAGEDFPANECNLFYWSLRNVDKKYRYVFEHMHPEIYDRRMPYPVVNYSLAAPFIVYAEDFGTGYHFCECSRNALKKYQSFSDAKQINIEEQQFANRVCFFCNRIVSRVPYTHPMYGSVFIQNWGWYVNQKAYENNRLIPTDDDENEVRTQLGFRKKGEQWENETLLFYIIKNIFPENQVVQHYRPKWLNGLEIDVWIEGESIGFEYQGIQHYHALKHWGGEEALKKQKMRDAEKERICIKKGIRLIKVKYTEPITEALVREKLLGASRIDNS